MPLLAEAYGYPATAIIGDGDHTVLPSALGFEYGQTVKRPSFGSRGYI